MTASRALTTIGACVTAAATGGILQAIATTTTDPELWSLLAWACLLLSLGELVRALWYIAEDPPR